MLEEYGFPLPLGEGKGEGYIDVPGLCKVATIEKIDTQFKIVFDAIRQLMTPPATKKRKIGFWRGSRLRLRKKWEIEG